MSVDYPIRAVAKLTGVSVDTLRAWERRYGAVTPQRKGRGRVYSDDDVRRLTRLRQAIERGHSIGQVAALDDDALDELLQGPNIARDTARPRRVETLSDRATPILEAIARFDPVGVELEMFRLASLMQTGPLVHEIVLPLMRTVGDLWQEGELSVSQEHLASSVTRNLLGTLIRTHPPHSGAGTIMIAAPAGELHEFGILAAALLAVSRGFGVTYLGADLPGREIVAAASRTGVDVVLIGVSNPEPQQGVVDEVRLITRALPARHSLWVGGASPEALVAGTSRKNVVVLHDFDSLEENLGKFRR